MNISPAWFLAFPFSLLAAYVLLDRWDRRRKRQREQVQQVSDRLRGIKPPQATYAQSVKAPSLWDAMASWLLPRSYWPSDPEELRTFLRIDVYFKLSAADRLRLLLTGDMRLLATVYTDVPVNEARTLANVEIHPFKVKE